MATYTEHEQRMLDQQSGREIDRIMDGVSLERAQEISAECHAWELVQRLMAAVAGDAHWRHDAQQLLRKIHAGELHEPPNRSA
jgi:hypothetical protein